MKTNYLGLLLSLLPLLINAQDLEFDWALSFGGTSSEGSSALTLDLSGNLYVIGIFEDTTDFDPSTDTLNLYSKGGWDFFIQKLDANGDLVWVTSIGGSSDDFAKSINVNNGNIYVTGIFRDTVDFDPSANVFNLISNGQSDVFIQKFDTDGNFMWATSIGNDLYDASMSITSDPSGNVYITGHYQNTVDFDPSTASFNMTSISSWDSFILKLNSNGNFVWAKSMGGTDVDVGKSITAGPFGNIYSTGHFQGTADFDPSGNTFNLTSNGGDDVYIVKFDTTGKFIWANSIGGASENGSSLIYVDSLENVYTTGFLEGTADFDPGVATYNLTSNGNYDAFIQKLDSSGNYVWAKSIGGIELDVGQSIVTDVFGNVYLSGIYKESVDFDPGPASFSFISNGNYDAFVLKLDAMGNFVWAESLGGSYSEDGESITIDGSGNLYVLGVYGSTVDFDPGMGTYMLMSQGESDVYIQKLSQVDPNSTGEINSVFNSLTVFPNPCDGLININLGSLKEISIRVFSARGRLIYANNNISTSIHQFKLDGESGVYIVEVNSQLEKQHYKLVKW